MGADPYLGVGVGAVLGLDLCLGRDRGLCLRLSLHLGLA